MSLCINPNCSKPDNSDNLLFCESCGSELLLEGNYRAIKLLGEGGFGRTYEVIDVHSNSKRVLKILINNQPKAVELFKREAEVLEVLNHPGIPKVEEGDYFIYFPRNSQQPLHCLLMEKIEGMDLYEYMKEKQFRPIKEKLALRWLNKIVAILQLVHDNNFFHRDIKPPNIMLRANGQLVLIDFGAAREVTTTYCCAQQKRKVTGINSPGYTPNEQINFKAVPQSDFFALGRTFVFLLTGKEPLDPAIYDDYNDDLYWRDAVPDISPKFADLIDRMMGRLPRERPADTREILQCLAEIEQPSSIPQSSPPTALINKTVSAKTSNQPTPQKVGWGFWWMWLLANSLILTPTITITLSVISVQFNLAMLTVAGILLPITQWLILRIYVTWVSDTSRWILVTSIGVIFGLFVFYMIPWFIYHNTVYYVTEAGIMTLVFASIGAIGIIQWLLLRRWVCKSWQWILANTIGGSPAIIADLLWRYESSLKNDAFTVVNTFVGLTIFAAITGFVLMRLLRNPIPKS